MMKPYIKKTYPHLMAILLFVAISAAYFAPQLKGYIIRQHDIENFIGMSREIVEHRERYNEDPLWTNSSFGGMPAFQISVENTNIVNRIKNWVLKVIPRPIGYMFFLMLGAYILLLCFNVKPWVALIGGIAFGLTSLNLLYLGAGHNAKVHAISFIPPIVGGIFLAYRKNMWYGAVLFSIFLCLNITANHLQMTYYLTYLILAMGIVELVRAYKEKIMPRFFKVTAILIVAGGLGILPTLSNLLITNEYSEHTTRSESELTIIGDETEDESKNIALERGYIKQYSFGKAEIWSMVVPNIKGGRTGALGNNKEVMQSVDQRYRQTVAQQNAYWGEQLSSGGTFYFGASVFLLFLLGAFFIKDRIKWAFIAVSLLAVVLSWKYGALTDFFIDNMPLYNKFRDTKMMLILVQLSFPLMGLWFVQKLVDQGIDKKKYLYISLSVSGLFLLFYIAPKLWFDFLSRNEVQMFDQQMDAYRNNTNYYNSLLAVKNNLIDARVEIYKKDMLRSLFFILLTAGLVYAFIIKKIKTNTLLVALGLIILFDLWSVSKRYLNNEKQGSQYLHWVDAYDYSNPFKASVADLSILESEFIEKPELKTRIEQDVAQMKNTEKLKPADFQNEKIKELFAGLNFATGYRVFTLQNPFNNARNAYFHKSLGGYHGAKLRLFNELIEYQISREYSLLHNFANNNPVENQLSELPPLQIPVLNMLNTKYIISDLNSPAYINPYRYGSTWFVSQIEEVENADQEIMALSTITPEKVIIQSKYMDMIDTAIGADTAATIELISYKPNHLVYSSSASSPQLAVFSEIYYPDGWNAYINGEKKDHAKANYVLRVMNVPAGQHTIEFKFEPQTFYKGKKLSIVGSVLILIFVAAGLFLGYRKKENNGA
jgi:hypothetical protein